MEDNKYYCRWCDYFLKDGQVKGIEDNDPRCIYCNHPVDSEQAIAKVEDDSEANREKWYSEDSDDLPELNEGQFTGGDA